MWRGAQIAACLPSSTQNHLRLSPLKVGIKAFNPRNRPDLPATQVGPSCLAGRSLAAPRPLAVHMACLHSILLASSFDLDYIHVIWYYYCFVRLYFTLYLIIFFIILYITLHWIIIIILYHVFIYHITLDGAISMSGLARSSSTRWTQGGGAPPPDPDPKRPLGPPDANHH